MIPLFHFNWFPLEECFADSILSFNFQILFHVFNKDDEQAKAAGAGSFPAVFVWFENFRKF